MKKIKIITLIVLGLIVFNVASQTTFALDLGGGSTNTTGSGGSTNTTGSGGSTNTGGSGGSTNTGGSGGSTNTTGALTLPSFLNNNADTLPKVLNLLIDIVTEFGAVVAVLFIIWSGFLFVKAQGNQDALKKAKSTLYTTIIGTAILLGASVIAKIILNTLSQITNHPF